MSYMTEQWLTDELYRLRADNERLREQLRLANIDAASNEAEGNDKDMVLQKAREAVEFSELAIDDWLNTFAPEHCDENRVAQAKSRIWNRGGTLNYIAEVQHGNRTALAAIDSALGNVREG